MPDLTDTWNYADAYGFMERVREGMPPLIICCACNGGVQGKEYNEAIPETPDEIAESVGGAYDAGASMVHVHARNPERQSSSATRTEHWLEVNRRIRERCPDIIINDTTGASHEATMEERLSCLDANPEVASLNLSPEMVRFKLKAREAPLPDPHGPVEIDDCLPWTYSIIERFAGAMKERGIKPELETYHPGGSWVINGLIEKDLIAAPYWIQTVMGYQTASYPTVDNVLQIVREFPAGTQWLMSGIGPFQLPLTTLATLMGGHVRVGLEDNIYYSRGRKLKSNREVVERAVRIANELNRDVATPAQARAMLGLPAEPTTYAQASVSA